jgi:hypothetical protein
MLKPLLEVTEDEGPRIIFFDPKQPRSKRQAELEQSYTRSHAAKVSHRRRRERKLSGSEGVKQEQAQLLTTAAISQHDFDGKNHQKPPRPSALGRHDPFSSYPGSDLPDLCLKVIHSGKFTSPTTPARTRSFN